MPEYHNVRFSNLKDKFGLIFDGVEWITKNIKAYKALLPIKQKAIDRMLEMDVDNKHIKKTKDELIMLMYNKRKYVYYKLSRHRSSFLFKS